MPKWVAEQNAKKKKKETYKPNTQTGSTPSQSSSVAKQTDTGTGRSNGVEERTKNSTFLGGGSSVRRTEERVNKGPSATKLSEVERRTQKTYGTTKPNLITQEQRNERRTERRNASETRRTQAQAVKSGEYARRENATEWGRDISDTITHTLKQTKAADLKVLNKSMQGITQKDAFLYTTEAQRQKADEKVKRRDEKYTKQIQTENEALEKIKEGHGYLGQQALSAVSSATGMAADISTGVPLASMWVRSTGTSEGQVKQKADALRSQLKNTGYYTDDQLDEMFKNVDALDMANAAASGGIEVISELFFRGFGPVAKYVGKSSIAEKVGAKLFNKAESKVSGGLMRNALRGTAEEVAEEEIGGPMQAWAANIIYGKKFQGYNEDAVRHALEDQSNAMRSQINSEVDAQQAAARLNSPAFMDESIKAYTDSGYSKEEATKLAEMARDYLAASLSGDVDGMKTTQDAMVDMLTGGEKSMKEKFTLQDAIDAAVSTSMMTLPTGMPGAMSTMQIGNAYKENIGLDAVRQQAEIIRNWGDEEDESKAQAVMDHIDKGNDMSGTQVYEIVQKAGEVAAEGREVEVTKNQVAERQMRNLDLRIDPRNPDGTLAPQTEQRYEEIVTKTMSKYSALARIGESSGYSTEDIELGADIGASFETGVISSEQVNELAKGNDAVREVFHDVTGIDLDQFDNNRQMRDALMAQAADNLVNSARIEQIAWNDEVKGGVADSLSKGIGGSGDTAVQKVLETVDPRDRGNFLLTADVARSVYDRARNTEESWNDTKRIFREMYPSVDMDVMRDVYNAAKEDKAKGEAYYGKVVTAGDKTTRSSLNGADTAYVAGKFTDKRQNKEGKSLQEESLLKSIAKAFDINIDVVDDLASVRRDSNGNPILDSEGNPLYRQDNGLFDPKTSTLILNAHPDATRTITQTMAHELTHHIAVHAPEEYVKLQKYIMDAWYRQDANRFNREINRIKALYKAQKNQDLTTEQALEELIADGAADFDWSDEQFIADVTVNEPTLAQKIVDAIKDVLRRIRSILASGDVIDPASTEALYAKAIEFDTVRSMWVKAAQMARNDRAQKAIDEWQDKANRQNSTRFSVSEPIERVKDLIAVHNLKPDDIRNAFELGGFPMPSIAVTKDSMGHDEYGDITLMFHSDTIDPEFFRSNQVFGGDAWTPTFPSIAKKVSRKVADKVDQKLKDILGLSQNDYTLGDLRLPSLDDDNLTNALRYNEPYDAFKNDEVFQIAYLKNAKNFDVAVPTKAGTIRSLDRQALEYLDDRLPEITYNDIYDTVDHTMEYEPAVRQARKDYYESKGGVKLKALAKHLDEKMGYSDVIARLEATIKYRESGIPEVVDRDALKNILDENVDQEGYKAWIDDLFDGIIEKTGIRNDKDMFTPSGNRRSWESLHDPVTLENVVKVMRAELAAGGTGIFGSNPKGAAQKQYKSLDEIRADEDRLQQLSEEEYKVQSEEAVGKMSEVCVAIAEHNPKRFSNRFGAALDVGSDIAEILNSTRNRNTIQRKLKKDYLLNVTDDQMDDLMDAIDAIANLPTGYFEAKPRRAVGFDEVKAAIIPQNTDEDIKAGLEIRGIPFYEYDPEVDGDRTEVVNQAATEKNLRFSISEDAHVMYTPKGVEVVQNPTDSEYNSMREEILAEYPWLRGTGEPLLRKTYDESGNEYYWNAFEAMHSQVEPYINKEYNTRTSQQWKWYEKPDKDDYPIDYSKQDYRFSITDSEGNSLSEGQAEFFADSKMVDAEGRLKPMYHGTQSEFYEFDITKAYPGTLGRGFYFADSDSHAGVYGKTNKYYLNLVNPLTPGTNNITKDQLHRFVSELAEDEDYGLENYGYGATVDSVVASVWGKTDFAMLRDLNLTAVGDFAEAIKVFNRVNDTDYDGIITDTETIAFYPQQVKSVDNLNPTLSKDTRYSITDSDGKELSDGQMEYFKNSQARDEKGRLVPVYHTTNRGGFTVFDPSYSDDKRSLFFASNWDVSQTYGYGANEQIEYKDIPQFSYVASLEDLQNVFGDVEDYFDIKVKTRFGQNDEPIPFIEWAEQSAKNGLVGGLYIEYKIPDISNTKVYKSTTFGELLYEINTGYANLAKGHGQRGYYECYLNLENPMIVDAQGQDWHSIPYGTYSEDSVLAIKNLTVQDLGETDGIYVNVWGDRKVDGKWQEFRESTAYPYEYDHDEIPESAWDQVYDFLIAQGFSDEFADNNTGYFFDFNGLNTFDERGKLTESKVGRYTTRNLASMAEDEGHDGVIIKNCRDIGAASSLARGSSAISDIYIAFSSNQVKDINNENPTENPDIRYSTVDDEESMSQLAYDDAMDDSYEEYLAYETHKAYGNEDEYFKGKAYLANMNEESLARFLDALKEPEAVPSADAVFEEDRVRRATSKQDFFNNVNAKWNERWYTEGEVLELKSVKKDVKNLVMGIMANSDTDAQYRADIVRRTLIDMRTAYQLMKQDHVELASYILYQSALDMIDGVEFIRDDTAFKEYKEIRDFLRSTRINAPEEYWHNETFHDFRKAYYGRLRIGKGNNNIESVYQDCADRWPHLFNEAEREKAGYGDHPEDLLFHMGEVVDSNVTPFMEAYSSEEAVGLAYEIADDLYDIMAGGEELVSLADSYKQKYDRQTKAMKQRHAEAILRERKIREDGIRNERERFRAYKEKQKEKRYHTKYFESIKASYDKLVERLASNTADKHIPEQYKKTLARLLAAFDLQTVGSKAREERTGQTAQKTIRMAAIRQALKDIEDKSDMFHINDTITDLMDELSDIDGKTVDALSVDELHKIDQILKSLLHEFNHYEKVKVGIKSLQVSDLANAQVQSALRHAKQFGPGNDYYGPIGWMDQIINMDEMTPAYMFKHIDPESEGLGIMWKEIRRSQDKYIRNTEQISGWIDEITGKYKSRGHLWKKFGNEEIERWRSARYTQTFNLKNGTVKLTPAQMMSLYCLSKRKQAYGHMVGAGIVVAPVTFQAKLTSDLKRKTNRALPVILDDADIKQIVTALTPEQIKVADQLQELMSTKMADMGNEASMNVLGIKLFTESDYFPIKSDKAALDKDLTNEQFENAIRNFGFTKAVQPGARNAIMVDDIFDVVTEHCNNMNLYNAYSETLNDFMKVFNKHSIQEDGSDYSVRQAIAHAYSNKATNFIMEFIKDLNGNTSRGRRTGIENAMNDMLANAKKASVFANIRVLLQQPTAITRAFAVIDPKYVKGINLGDVAKGIIPTVTTEAMQEMFEHCPIALWKSWGYYDINMGRNIEDVIMNEGNWLEELATQAYGKADNITWTAIWQMVKAEMKDTHPEVKEGTDDYWELCNERMSEIVDLTQVVDSPLHRSHAMRSKDFLHKTTTAFMAEPTLTFNMIRDGWVRSREAWKTGNKGEAAKIWGRVVGVTMLQAVTVAAAAAVADALRGKNAGGDDDEGKSLWLINFINNLKDELKIWNKVYYIKDLASIAEGWDNANLALQGWQNLCTGYNQLVKKLYEGSKVPWWKIYYNFFGGVGYFLGVPIKTLMRDGRALFEMLGGKMPESLVGEEKTKGVIAEDSVLQKARIFKKDTDKSSSSTSMVKVSTEDKWYDYERNPITVKDGSSLDKLLNSFGINLTAAEKNAIAEEEKQKERDQKIADIQTKYADLSGEERDKKVWSAITSYVKDESEGGRSFKDMIAAGDYGDINEMKQMYLSAGGGADYFDERVFAESKTALLKSIKYDQSTKEVNAQEHIKDYLLANGMTEADVSEVVYKSDLAKDMKVAFRLGDKELMLETLEPLVNAGLTYDDLCRLWENRNRMQLSSYKGRYKDKLQSTGSYIWPTQGTITSGFGPRSAPTAGASSYHSAIDIGAPQGTPVVAADGGVIVEAGANGGYGNSVGIRHDDGTISYYNHLYSWNVKVGDTVAQGQQIGQVGSTGISTGPHLDFRLYKNGEYLNPEEYLGA